MTFACVSDGVTAGVEELTLLSISTTTKNLLVCAPEDPLNVVIPPVKFIDDFRQ